MKTGPFSLKTIFAIPAVVAGLSLFGLVAALIGNGVWDVLGWASLGVSMIVLAWALVARRRR